jgi:hypothetical protein
MKLFDHSFAQTLGSFLLVLIGTLTTSILLALAVYIMTISFERVTEMVRSSISTSEVTIPQPSDATTSKQYILPTTPWRLPWGYSPQSNGDANMDLER